MSDLTDHNLPSLARAFEPERQELSTALRADKLSAAQAVSEARKALDATGRRFARETEDMAVEKAGLWLLEMVKTGAASLDRGTKAEIIWREVPPKTPSKIAGSTLFYGAAGVFAVSGLINGITPLIWCAGVLAGLRFFDPQKLKSWADKLPFINTSTPNVIEDQRGTRHLADAEIVIDSAGLVDSLADALRTADHILARLAEPAPDVSWYDNARLMSLMQGLLEAHAAGDGEFALKLVETELQSTLRADGLETVKYSANSKRMFDLLPVLDEENGETKMAAPAIIKGERVIRRGTVWKSE